MRGSQVVLLITELAPRAREIGFGSGREKPVYKQGIRLSVNSKSFTSLKLKRLSTSIAVRVDNIRVALILAPNTRTIIFTGMWQALFLRSLACAVVPACAPGPPLSSIPCYSSHPWYKGTVKSRHKTWRRSWCQWHPSHSNFSKKQRWDDSRTHWPRIWFDNVIW